MIYRGALPEYAEVGPYTYKEVNQYSEIQYGTQVQGTEAKGVKATLTQSLEYVPDGEQDEDE